jgi:hypothetical protein
MDMSLILTLRELRDRKVWAWLLVATCVGSAVGYVDMAWQLCSLLGTEGVPSGSAIQDRVMRLSSFAAMMSFPVNWTVCFLMYRYCYKNYRTFLLSLILLGTGLGIFGILFLWYTDAVPRGMIFILNNAFMVVMGVYTWKMRKMNRVLRCHARAPIQCSGAIAHLKNARTVAELNELWKSGKKKWPALRPILKREYENIRRVFF